MISTSAKMVKRWVWDTQVRLLLGIGISLALGWLSIKGMDWGLVADQFHTFPLGWVFLSLALVILGSVLRAYRWQALFVEQRPSFARLFLVQNAGIGLNNLAPVRVVSEGVQYGLLTMRYGVRGGAALATLGVERLLDMVVTASILMAGLTLLPSKGDFLLYVVGAFVFALVSVLAIPLLMWLVRRSVLNRISLLVSASGFLADMARAKLNLACAFFLTLGHWLVLGFGAWALAHGMGLEISPFEATLAILGTLYFATAVPALPAAVGTFEFAVVYVLKVFEIPQEAAISYAVVIHAVLFLPPIVIAIVAFAIMGVGRRRHEDATGSLGEPGRLVADNQERRAR